MYASIAAALALVASVAPAAADAMKAEEARHFVVGKVFSYACFEGTRGAGRIYSDGSVAGTIQLRGAGPVRYVRLPPNTLRVKGESVCASVRGLPFEPCFNLAKTSPASFRGSIYGLSFAYCEFNRRGRRIDIARKPRQSKDLPLRAAIDAP
ncbi:MAG: hypothetical protein GEU91_10225 [Rhizobiales bacterium]|nr:hypothetical protein [Hyphomicrobiales bacterium]